MGAVTDAELGHGAVDVGRTDPQVRRLRLSIRTTRSIGTTRDETLDLLPLAEDPEVGLVFYPTLVPRTTELLSIQGFGDDGEPLPEPAPPLIRPKAASPASAGWPRAVNMCKRL